MEGYRNLDAAVMGKAMECHQGSLLAGVMGGHSMSWLWRALGMAALGAGAYRTLRACSDTKGPFRSPYK